jgi:gliding motility-associated-like protein
MKKHYLKLFICLNLVVLNSFGQSDCSTALPLCSDANSGGVVNGFGFDDFNGRVVSGCLKNGLNVNTIETNSFWFRVKLAESGEFGFNVKPNVLSEDWDFAVYGPNPTCGALGDPVKCNYSKVSTTGYTGVGIDPVNGTQTAAYDSWMNVIGGEEYVVLINQYAGNNAGFSIEWKGAVIDNNTDPLDCSILVNLGPDRNLCSGQSTILNATTFGSTVTYKWSKFNNVSGVFEPILPAETAPTLLVNTTGNYKIEVTDTVTGVVKEDDIVVTIHTIPTAGSANNMVLCDTDNDGVEKFDLNFQTSAITNGQVGMSVTYHQSQTFAKAGASPLTSPYSSAGTTIWARIANAGNSNCYDIVSFQLIVAKPPLATKPPNLKECDDNNDGSYIFNLDQQTPIVLAGQTGQVITYYADEANANDYKGWIVNTATYSSITRTIWVRVEPSGGSNCYALTSFDIEVLASATANLPTNIQQCDDNNDGRYEFDFNASKDSEILASQNPATFVINYFATQVDADNNLNILPKPYINTTPYAIETIYARIQNIASSTCYATTSFTLQVFDSAFPPIPSEIPDLTYCDDLTDGSDTNGFYQFNLTERASAILNNQSPFVFNITYFQDPGYLNQISNPLNFPNTVVGGQTIYVRVTNTNPNNVSCFAETSFNIKVEPLPSALIGSFDFKQCDEDGNPDGIIDFNLAEADTFLSLGNPNLIVSYHLLPSDAASGINVQNKYPFSNNTASTVYGRVQSANGCYRIVPVNLSVSVTSFPANYLRVLTECDDDNVIDGLHVFDLAQTTSEIISLFLPSQNLRVSYFRNQLDAISESNTINQTTSYFSEVPFNETIWVRVESAVDGGCFGVAPVIQLVVNPRPEFELNETGVVCLNNAPLIEAIYNSKGLYTYEWIDPNGLIISQQTNAQLFEAGTYTVIATSNLGCKSFPKTITITESNIADISAEDIQINDNSSNNSVSINTANQNLGIGDYEFTLDNILGPYQDGAIFTQVLPGEHTVFVREKNNCGIAQVKIYVFGFPNFFTPNEDGKNDTWNVLGVNPSIFPESSIYIFDRYGKMLTNFSANQIGWDGFYNNKKVNSSDYWYLAQITDNNGITREYKGHFSLIR